MPQRGPKFLLVIVDYFTKWIEAEPLATVTGMKMIKFMWKNILTRFGTPSFLICDSSTQFEGIPFKEWCEEKKTHRWFTSVAHPQTNGQTEVSNKISVNGLKKRLMKSKAAWVEELPKMLWSYHSTSSSSTRETPFSLTYDI